MEKTGSTFKVPLTEIVDIIPHPKADRLEVAVIYGFQVIVQKDRYKVGDEVIYVPIDSILPQNIEDKLFPSESKIKLTKHRIRQIKIRGLASQGMIIDPLEIKEFVDTAHHQVEDDLAKELNITKYEPPQAHHPVIGVTTKKEKAFENKNFHKYGGLDNIKWYPQLFKEDEIIVLQEKIHGTNARAAIMPFQANTLWKKILKFFNMHPTSEFCYGSNNVQLQNKSNHTGFYGEDVYGQVFKQLNVKDKLKFGETIYGEIYGEGIQKNYTYGCKSGERKFVLFDVRVLQADGTHKWLSPDEVSAFAKERGFDMIPEVYRGPYKNLEFIKSFTTGNSVLAPSQKVREGVVVKALTEYDQHGHNRALKVISEDYLSDENNTEFH